MGPVVKIAVTLMLVGGIGLPVAASQADMSPAAIAERIKPVGEVRLAGESDAGAGEAVAAGPRSGDTVFNTYCMACHATGALNAPKRGDKAAWEPRVAQGKETLLSHALNGFNAMPPKGTCMDCSEEEIQAAIDFMLE